ncbi:DUF3617 domain-containing protein [Altererythrobacter sp. ZODW24]|uniref:DUF3617 domain-containing protein n=1 Tax=Altererythrobacter sp. ZODW24 TaxID=2185142 RepID=UPI000DF81206|nr:DUF3617 domain-containing protein [Altererythrobacter sp. ZODW24]
MRSIILPLAALATLSACGESEQSEPVAVNEIVSEAQKLNKPMPGQYRSTAKLIEIDLPGMPESVAAQMKDQMSEMQSQTSEQCLTEAQVDKGWEDMVKNMNNATEDADCQFDKFDVEGGNLDAQMTCTAAAGIAAKIAMTGKMEPEKQVMTMVVSQSGGPSQMNMKMEVTNERIGDCGDAG